MKYVKRLKMIWRETAATRIFYDKGARGREKPRLLLFFSAVKYVSVCAFEFGDDDILQQCS